ncbi:MAG: sialidase family protein [Niabella sp.]
MNCIKKNIYLIILALLMTSCTRSANWDDTKKEELPTVTSVPFFPGDDGYVSYRIPAMVATKSGAILAFAEGRRNSYEDHGDIDIVMKRSLDNGVSWSKLIIIKDDGTNRCQNPVPVYIPDINRVVLVTCWNYGATGVRQVFVRYSDDEGLTWTEDKNITASVKKKEWNWYGTGPCHGIVKKHPPYKGRIVVPANHSLLSDKSAFSHIIYSDDNGLTWNVGGVVSRPNTGESTVVETSDGKLILNMRNEDLATPRYRIEAISEDGGTTWGDCYENKQLPDPKCQASIYRYEDDHTGFLLFSNQDQMEARKGLTLKVSLDDGKTWAHKVNYHNAKLYGGYSDITKLDNGDVGVLFEDGWQVLDGIRFERLSLKELQLNK